MIEKFDQFKMLEAGEDPDRLDKITDLSQQMTKLLWLLLNQNDPGIILNSLSILILGSIRQTIEEDKYEEYIKLLSIQLFESLTSLKNRKE